ncbi:MAG: hypothetical protein H7Y18_10060 [Clostridiaceae bacterium]|nr:hypothetical protein [Clostridiaceae bacterium]
MNKFKVETHDNSREYFRDIILEENALYITSSSSLRDMLIDENINFNKNKFYVQDYKKFFEGLFPFKGDLLFQNTLKRSLRAEAYSLIKVLSSEEVAELQEGLKHLEELYEAMEAIMIFGIGEFKKTEELNLSEIVFMKLYNRLLSEKNWKTIYEDYSNLGSFSNIEEKIEGFKGPRINKIYFYNFREISISRYIVFQMLRFAGYEIEFKAPYFIGLNNTNTWFNKLYGEDFIISSNSDKSFETETKSCKYIALVEGAKLPEVDNYNIELRNYAAIAEFKKDITKATKVISFNKDKIDLCLPKKNNLENHCYHTSVGRFIKEIFQCQLVKGSIKISFDTYFNMLTSGWIETSDKNGISARDFLAQNRALFCDCSTLEQINIRIDQLITFTQNISVIDKLAEEKVGKSQVKKFLSNPFKAVSYLNMDNYHITASELSELSTMFGTIMHKLLENTNGYINYNTFMIELKGLYAGNQYFKAMINRNKIWYMKKIQLAFSYKIEEEVLHFNELKELMNILLENESVVSALKISQSIDHLEGLIYGRQNTLFITDLSFNAYKEYNFKKSKENRFIKLDFIERISKGNQLVLGGIRLEKLSKVIVADYLKFTLVNSLIHFKGNFKFSFIKDLREDDSEGPLFSEMKNLYGVKDNVTLDFSEFKELSQKESMLGLDLSKYSIKHSDIPDSAYIDLDLCSLKFLYSSIVKPYPVYLSKVEQTKLLSVLVSIMKNTLENKFILPLFPQINQEIKENITSENHVTENIREYKTFENISYPKVMDYLYSLGSRDKSSGVETKTRFKEFLKQYEKSFDLGQEGLHCTLCPHNLICRKGSLEIDRRG